MLKVLIVDDETVVRRGIMLGTDWAAMDCVVVGEASNGEEGLAAAARYNPNLIITDVRMPRMDGIEMMRRLREQDCTAHFIVLTAYDEFDYARSALRYGAADYPERADVLFQRNEDEAKARFEHLQKLVEMYDK